MRRQGIDFSSIYFTNLVWFGLPRPAVFSKPLKFMIELCTMHTITYSFRKFHLICTLSNCNQTLFLPNKDQIVKQTNNSSKTVFFSFKAVIWSYSYIFVVIFMFKKKKMLPLPSQVTSCVFFSCVSYIKLCKRDFWHYWSNLVRFVCKNSIQQKLRTKTKEKKEEVKPSLLYSGRRKKCKQARLKLKISSVK